jgi:hypothetical protein
MDIIGYKLEKTCGACPEQYDVYKDDKLVGYLRLRHGNFSARAFGVDGTEVYHAHTIGDGIFEHDERQFHLVMAINAIDLFLRSQGDEPCGE